MNEEDKGADAGVLALVRDHVREERADDAALEAIARGDDGAQAAAVRALRERAEQGDDVARAMVDACAPLGTEVLERIAHEAEGPTRAAAAPASAAPASAAASAPAAAPSAVPAATKEAPARAGSGRVLAFARRAAIIAAPLAVAAAVFFVFGSRSTESGGAALPEFAITASGEKEMRGADAPAASVLHVRGAPDATFEILARPSTSVGGARVIAYAFAIGEGEPNPVDAKVEIAPEGSVRIRGRVRALMGAREVRVVLAGVGDSGAPSDSIKRYEDALVHARDGKSDAQVRVLVVKIVRD